MARLSATRIPKRLRHVERGQPLALVHGLVDQAGDSPQLVFRAIGIGELRNAGVALEVAGLRQLLETLLRRRAAELRRGRTVQGRHRRGDVAIGARGSFRRLLQSLTKIRRQPGR